MSKPDAYVRLLDTIADLKVQLLGATASNEALRKELTDYQRLVEVWRKRSDAKTDRTAELEAACIALRDDLEETLPYAPSYFQEKWELGASLKLPVVAALPASETPSVEPETCKWCDLPPADGDNICAGHRASHAAHSSLPPTVKP